MPLISDTIANLIGGVSQQAENLRFSNTANELVNAFASPVSGLQKRHAAEFVGEMNAFGGTADLSFDDRAAVHFIDRDIVERYVLVADSSGVKAFDADTSDAIEVEYVGGSMPSYLTSNGSGGTLTDYANDLRFITVADTTFLLNRNVTANGSTGADFKDYHFAAFPQLEYDTDRGGSKGGRKVDSSIKTSGSAGYRTLYFSQGKTVDTGNFTIGFINDANALMGLAKQASGTSTTSTDQIVSTFLSTTGANDFNSRLSLPDVHQYLRRYEVNQFANRVERYPFYSSGATQGDFIAEYGPSSDTTPGHADNNLGSIWYEQATVLSTTAGYMTDDDLRKCFVGPYYGLDDITSSGSTLTFRVVRQDAKDYSGYSSTVGTATRAIVNDLRVNSVGTIEISDGAGGYRNITVSRSDSTADIYLPHSANATIGTNPQLGGGMYWQSAPAGTTWPSTTLDIINDLIQIAHDGANYTVGVTDEELRILVADGAGFSLTKNAAGTVTSFDDLPPEAANGRVISVGGVGEGDGTFFVIGIDGEYVETYAVPYVIDDDTMPHTIKRKFRSDGTPYFEVGPHQYAAPSFINNTINDIFVYKGRLGFLSDENVIMSGANEFGTTANFFRKTVIQLLDDDRIDIGMSTGRIDILKNAVSFADTLMVMSDRAQFKLVSGTALSPNTVSIQQSTAFSVSPTVKPINAGNTIYFAQDNLNFTTVREMVAEYDTDIIETNEVTGQAPRYIPTGVFGMAVSTKKELLCLSTSNEPNSIYVYKYYKNEGQRLQSAWSKWQYNADTKVLGFNFIDDYLVQVISVTTPDYVGSLELAAGATSTTYGSMSTRTYIVRTKIEEITSVSSSSFPILLDMRVSRSQCASVVGLRTDQTNTAVTGLPLGTDSTTIELPYRTSSTKLVALRTGSDDYGQAMPFIAATNFKLDALAGGTVAELTARTQAFAASPSQTTADAITAILDTTASNTYLTVFGRHDNEQTNPLTQTFDLTDQPDFAVGLTYEFNFEISPIYYKPGQTTVGRNDSRLQLRYATVTYDDTVGFSIEVTPAGRQKTVRQFNSLAFGDSTDKLGVLAFDTGAFRFPIMSKNDRVKITFKNSQPFPSTLTTIEWEGFISPKTLRG
jgi:hypothetical protein